MGVLRDISFRLTGRRAASPKSAAAGAVCLAMALATGLVSCDSGDVYPPPPEVSKRQVNASFSFEGLGAFPESEYYQVVFAAFAEGSVYPLTYKAVTKPSSGNVEVSLANIPDEAGTVSLALLDKGKKLVFDFYSYPVADMGDETITLTQQEITLYSYARVQKQIFDIKCTACHGAGESSARGLDLTAGHSYAALVNRNSTKAPSELLVMPYSASRSFLIEALTVLNILTPDHTEIVKTDDTGLLREWIANGCPE